MAEALCVRHGALFIFIHAAALSGAKTTCYGPVYFAYAYATIDPYQPFNIIATKIRVQGKASPLWLLLHRLSCLAVLATLALALVVHLAYS